MRIIVQFYTDKLSHKVSHDGWFYTPKWYYIKTISGWLVVSMPSHHAPVSILRFVRYVLINIISHSIPFKTPVQHIIYIYVIWISKDVQKISTPVLFNSWYELFFNNNNNKKQQQQYSNSNSNSHLIYIYVYIRYLRLLILINRSCYKYVACYILVA